jgi:predicted transcriptional regulator
VDIAKYMPYRPHHLPFDWPYYLIKLTQRIFQGILKSWIWTTNGGFLLSTPTYSPDLWTRKSAECGQLKVCYSTGDGKYHISPLIRAKTSAG